MTVNDKATQVAGILQGHYASQKYDPRFTLWGTCYFWNPEQGAFQEEYTDSGLEEVVSTIFTRAERRTKLKKPRGLPAKAQDERAYYAQLALSNRGVITTGFADLFSDGEDVSSIVDDSQLLQEAMDAYLQGVGGGSVPVTTNFVDFMLYHQPDTPFDMDKQPGGIYLPLLERTYVRLGEQHLITGLADIVHSDAPGRVQHLHDQALKESRVVIDEGLAEAHRKYDDGRQVVPLPQEPAAILSLSSVMGKRRKRVGSQGIIPDLAEYQRIMLGHQQKARLDPNTILERQLVDLMVARFLPDFESDEQRTMEEVRRLAEHADTESERKALNTTVELLQSMCGFSEHPRINHTMTINRRKE